MNGKKVAAVVLTYNRLSLLKECIAAIRLQTTSPDRIIVVNNGSKEDTTSWIKSQSDLLHIHLVQNIGPAAGMQKGLQEAYESGYEWIWVMDDDGLPHETALEKLQTTRPSAIGAKNSMVLDRADGKSLVFRMLHFKTLDDVLTDCVDGHIMPWNGTLIHRNVIEELGYPKSELFLWGEETEYFFRIKQSKKFEVFTVKDSWHFHPRTGGHFYKGQWDVNTNDRAYYFIRNKYAVYLSMHRKNKLKATLQYMLFNAGMFYYIVFRQPRQKIKKIKLLLLATKDGLTSNYAKSPSEIAALVKSL